MFAYIARQAIYDCEKRVFAYELLFRNGVQNCFPDISPDEATSSMLAASHLSVGVESITLNKPAFINFHQDTILYRFPSTLDPLNVVIEIVETVEVTSSLIKACEHISNLGYKIALDDYDFSEQWEAIMPLVSYIKLEVELVNLDDPKVVSKLAEFKQQGKILLAEKVETYEEFERLKAAGFQYFQGYFLSRPEVVKHKKIDISTSSVAELVGISVSPDFDTKKVQAVFEKDVGLAFKLMRFINNPLFNKRHKIETLDHALRYLGQVELKKFIALLAIANLKGNKPIDLLVSSLARAHFCKLLSAAMGLKQDPPTSFIIGLFSKIDALLDMNMEDVLKSLPFSESIVDVLCDFESQSILAEQFKICKALEQADWTQVDVLAKRMNLSIDDVFQMHYQAIVWANMMKDTFK
jgi:EAL and modified HD-GYP domain-containing signal transduction protein